MRHWPWVIVGALAVAALGASGLFVLKQGVKLEGLNPILLSKLHAAAQSLAARGRKLRLTSTTEGEHRVGSLHYLGRAVDVTPDPPEHGYDSATRDDLIRTLTAQGLRVIDEYARPSPRSTAGHLHVELVA